MSNENSNLITPEAEAALSQVKAKDASDSEKIVRELRGIHEELKKLNSLLNRRMKV